VDFNSQTKYVLNWKYLIIYLKINYDKNIALKTLTRAYLIIDKTIYETELKFNLTTLK